MCADGYARRWVWISLPTRLSGLPVTLMETPVSALPGPREIMVGVTVASVGSVRPTANTTGSWGTACTHDEAKGEAKGEAKDKVDRRETEDTRVEQACLKTRRVGHYY